MVRNLDQAHFDFLVGVLFNEDFSVSLACSIPYATVQSDASYNKHTNSWFFHLRDRVAKIAGVVDLTSKIRELQHEHERALEQAAPQ